jgi:diaminopimelate epimerase
MLKFSKYQGAGNDFVIIDNRNQVFPLVNREEIIEKLCDRRFGIGADGLILLELEEGVDFRMVYHNADGQESSMCGNGGRCIVSFASELGIIESKTVFTAIDGLHEALYFSQQQVELKMKDVDVIQVFDDHAILDTGSPHFVKFVDDVSTISIADEGRAIRKQAQFGEKGINVNFIQQTAQNLIVYTYERGVEDETLACGTGVTAAVLAMNEFRNNKDTDEVNVKVRGGVLKVKFRKENDVYKHIWLIGPGKKVFEGSIEL